eukprot:235788-Chlamydomonas_euryale.AAC.2
MERGSSRRGIHTCKCVGVSALAPAIHGVIYARRGLAPRAHSAAGPHLCRQLYCWLAGAKRGVPGSSSSCELAGGPAAGRNNVWLSPPLSSGTAGCSACGLAAPCT